MSNYFVVDKLNIFTFTLSIILKGFNFKTYYISAHSFFLRPKIFYKLQKLGIKAIEQNDFYPQIHGDFFHRTYELSLIELENFKASSFIIKGRKLLINSENIETQKKFDVLLLTELEKKLYSTGKLSVIAEYLKKHNPESLILISYSPIYSNLLKEKYPNISMPFSKYLLILSLLGYFFKKLYFKSFSYHSHEQSPTNNATAVPFSTYEKNCGQEVAFFPHEGIFYSSLFKKDFFYSANINSAFHPSKILHIALGDQSLDYHKSIKYYQENNIPFLDLLQLPTAPTRKIIFSLFSKLHHEIISDFVINGAQSLFLKLKIIFKISLYLEYLKNIKHLKVALITMETEFSQELALALSIRKVTMIAVQDRFILPFGPNCTTILDHYFSFGQFVADDLINHQNRFYTKNIHILGNIKVDILHNSQFEISDQYKKLKAQSKVILVLDFLMSHDYISSLWIGEANWSTGKRFYEDLYLLVREFPHIHFVLKGKNNSNYSIPEFIPYFNQLEALSNFTIEKDLDSYPPHVLGKIADACLCLYNSMADELLAYGKSVFIYDFCGLPGKYVDSPAICTDYADLVMKINRWDKEGSFMEQNALNQFRELYYSQSVRGPVRPKLLEEIEKIFDSIGHL